jgi:hypothetical protein
VSEATYWSAVTTVFAALAWLAAAAALALSYAGAFVAGVVCRSADGRVLRGLRRAAVAVARYVRREREEVKL